jgi:Domain of unknown function (DUF4913)
MTDDASFTVTVPADAGATGSQQTGPAPRGADAEHTPEPVYTAVEDWVTDYFLPMFRRTLGGELRWCAQWWQHGEAISRLTSLWHAWEALRLQPGTGIASWYRDHLDHQLPILMGARGPFYQCSETTHREPHQAAVIPAPGEWWDTEDAETAAPGGTAGATVTIGGLLRAPGLPPGARDKAGLGEDDA